MKRLLGFILLFSVILALPVKAETFVEGHLQYEITKSKEVRILGFTENAIDGWRETGNMPRELNIPSEINGLPVTEIADYAFYINGEEWDYESLIPFLNGVLLPNTLKRIGHYSFSGNQMTEIRLPNGLVEIGDYAFERNEITELILPNSIQKIGANIVRETNVTKIDLPKQLLVANEKTAGDLKYVTFTHDGKTEVRITGFNRKTSKTSLTVPEKIDNKAVTEIGDYAFSDANPLNPLGERTKLAQVALPATIKKIGDYAFYERGMQGELKLLNVQSIGMAAFKENKLTTVNLGNRLTILEEEVFFHNEIASLTLPKNLTVIESGAFAINKLKKLVLPATVQIVGNHAFASNLIQTAVLPESLKKIGEHAFSVNRLTEIILPSGVTEIADYAFFGNRFTSLNIPEHIKKIGAWAFASNRLQQVVIPTSVTTIGDYAFMNNRLKTLTVPNSLQVIQQGAFQDNQLEKIELPGTIKEIQSSAFSGNQLTDAVFPEGLETITDAYSNNNLKKLTIPSTVKNITANAFARNALTSVTIPENIQYIGESAFVANKLTAVQIKAPLKMIEAFTFADNELQEIQLPNTLQVIGNHAFINNELKQIVFPDALKNIGKQAFSANKIEMITLPQSLEIIDAYAFANNQLTNLQIPKNVKIIEREAFNNNKLMAVDFSFGLETIGAEAFKDNQLQTLTLPNSVKKIEYSAFANNKLTEVHLSESLTVIDGYLFKSNKLTEITIPPSVREIYAFAFSNNELKTLTVPKNVENFHLHSIIDTDIEAIHFEGDQAKVDRGFTWSPEQFTRQFGPLYTDAQKTKVWANWGNAVGARTLYVTWKNHDGTISGGATTEPKPVEPSNPVQPASIFTDTSTHWAKETIDALVDRGIISGYPDGTFRPNESMKRKHVASIMAKVYELKQTHAAATFSDVSTKHPNYDAITRLQQAGVIHGSDGKFRPEETLTRGQMAKILVLASGFTPGGKTTFTDITPAYWGYDYITALADLGVVGGDNGKYRPNASVTRGQFVGMLDKALKAMD